MFKMLYQTGSKSFGTITVDKLIANIEQFYFIFIFHQQRHVALLDNHQEN